MSDRTSEDRSSVVGEVNRLVPPRHCDAQGMMHASRPAEYFEDAFLAWLEAACAGYGSLRAAGVDLVIAESSVRYLGSIRLGDEVTATAVAIARGRTSLGIEFELIRDGDILVSATTTYVCVGESGPVDIPDVLTTATSAVPSRKTPGQR